MSVFYSILHVPLRVEADERLSLGLLMRAGNQVFFGYSTDKVNWVKDLMPEERHRLLKHALKNIEDTLSQDAQAVGAFQYALFPSPERASSFSQEPYLRYLSQYHHNLLTYTPPQPIDLPGTREVFLRLFEKLVGFAPTEVAPLQRAFDLEEVVSTQLYPQLQGRVNLDLQLTSREIPTLFLPTKVSFIGRNDAPMVGRAIDFNKRTYNLQHDLTEMYTLVKAFEEHGQQHGIYYVIGTEPVHSHPKAHDIWDTIRRSKTVTYVDLDDIACIAAYAEAHAVAPFLPEGG